MTTKILYSKYRDSQEKTIGLFELCAEKKVNVFIRPFNYISQSRTGWRECTNNLQAIIINTNTEVVIEKLKGWNQTAAILRCKEGIILLFVSHHCNTASVFLDRAKKQNIECTGVHPNVQLYVEKIIYFNQFYG